MIAGCPDLQLCIECNRVLSSLQELCNEGIDKLTKRIAPLDLGDNDHIVIATTKSLEYVGHAENCRDLCHRQVRVNLKIGDNTESIGSPIDLSFRADVEVVEPDTGRNLLWRPIGRVIIEASEASEDYESTFLVLPRVLYNGRQANASTRTLSESISIARNWLEDCIDNHVGCATRSQNFCPARLVEVGSHADNVRMLYSEELGDRKIPQYLALSYCWGTSQPCVLTLSTKAHFNKSLPVQSLSQILKDAIDLTRSLGFSYIWIDSLCIIQDSETDWAQQSRLMTKVYSNAVCTLAAESSHDAQISTLFPQNTRSVGFTKKFRMKWQGEESHHLILDEDLFTEKLRATALSHRGWALQETLLSTRILHLCDHEWAWTCRSIYACETFPLQLPALLSNRPNVFAVRSAAQISVDLRMASPESLGILWADIVSNYTSRSISKVTDKLVAIWGIVEELQNLTGERCFAGIWERRVFDQLCWSTPFGSGSSVSKTNIAPSWSWASVDAPIRPSSLWSPYSYSTHYPARLVEISTFDTIITRDGDNIVKTEGVIKLCAKLAKTKAFWSRTFRRYLVFELVLGNDDNTPLQYAEVSASSEMDAACLLHQALLVPIKESHKRFTGLLIYRSPCNIRNGHAVWTRGGALNIYTKNDFEWRPSLKRAHDHFDSSEESKEFEHEIVDGEKRYIVEIQ